MPDILPLRLSLPADDPPADPAGSPLVVGARHLAVMLCSSVRTVRTWDATGKLPTPIRIGGRVVWLVSEIRDWLKAGAPDRSTWAAIRAAKK